MFNFHKNHISLVSTAFLGFLLLSILIAIIPASQMQAVEPLPGQSDLRPIERQGLQLYVSEGCVACHTQQVRNIEMDKVWGDRPSLASDYYYNKKRLDFWRQSPSLLGSERTGPDLTNVGVRQASKDWHLLHLYNPRSVVEASIMPGYPWLFEEKTESEIKETDVLVPIGREYFSKAGKKVVASQEALALVAYLQSLKQPAIQAEVAVDFIPALQEEREGGGSSEKNLSVDGATLYVNTCAACHQRNGKGIVGAFPPLAGSTIVNSENPEMLIRIILQGYDARSEYGQMPSFALQLTDEEVAAIANHERSSWGNSAPTVSKEEVAKIRSMIESEPQ